MTTADDSIGSPPPRPWVGWLTLAGFSLFTIVLAGFIHFHSVVLGIAATLLVMAAPQAASRPFGCEAPRQMAAEAGHLRCPARAGTGCKPFLA